jgi:N-acetylmuramoyl-L-alanine amidase
MKRPALRFYVLFAFLAILHSGAFAQDRLKIITTSDVEISLPLQTIRNSPHVPLKEISNISKDLPSGWKVEWDDTFGILRFSGEKSSYSLFLDKKTFLVNDEVRQVQEPIAKKDGEIFVPVSSLEALKDVFREASILKQPEIKATPAELPSSPPTPVETPPAPPSASSYAPKEPSGVFRVMIDPAPEPLKWEKPSQSRAPLVEQEVVTLQIALGIRRILEQEKGVEVLLSAKKGENLSLEKRLERINTSGADIVVSLRLDASRFENLEGLDIYICSEALDPEAAGKKTVDKNGLLPLTQAYLPFQRESLALADSMFVELNSGLSCRVGSVTPAPLYLLKRTAKPAVLITCGYVSNPAEASQLTKENYLESLSRALSNGVLKYRNSMLGK